MTYGYAGTGVTCGYIGRGFLTYGYAGTGIKCSYIDRGSCRMGTLVQVLHVVTLVGVLDVWVRWYRCYM